MPLASKAASVADMLEAWYEHGVEVKDWTPATAHGYRSTLNAHLIPALGRHRLDKLTPSHVQALLNELRAGGLSPQTVKNVRAVLSSALNAHLIAGDEMGACRPQCRGSDRRSARRAG